MPWLPSIFPPKTITNPPAFGNGLGTGTRHGLQLFQFRAGLATGRCCALAHQCVAPRSGGSTWDTTKSYSLLAYATRKCTLAAIFFGFFLGSWVGVFYWYVASCSSCYVWFCVDMFCVIFMWWNHYWTADAFFQLQLHDFLRSLFYGPRSRWTASVGRDSIGMGLVALGTWCIWCQPRRMAAFMWMAVMLLNVAQACHTEWAPTLQ